MEKEKCFCIENKDIYLEQILVEYNDVPIFFLCSTGDEYYIALCTDIEDLNYIVVKISQIEIYNMFNGKITMRDIITNQNEYWEVISNEDICKDVVNKYPISNIDYTVLPEENAYYKALTDDVSKYKQKFETDFLNVECFDKEQTINLDNFYTTITFETPEINNFVEVVLDYSIKITSLINKKHNYEFESEDRCIISKKNNIKLSKFELDESWENDDIIYAA